MAAIARLEYRFALTKNDFTGAISVLSIIYFDPPIETELLRLLLRNRRVNFDHFDSAPEVLGQRTITSDTSGHIRQGLRPHGCN
jgi:hypothetical protein